MGVMFINILKKYDFYKWICNFVNTSAYYRLL